jgi:hypothetical protein
VITREDLDGPQFAVQAIHATFESLRKSPYPQSNEHPHVILCAAKDELALHRLLRKFAARGIILYPFYEPNRDNEMTALASSVVYNRQPFRKLKLFRSQQ